MIVKNIFIVLFFFCQVCAPYWTATGLYDSAFPTLAKNRINQDNRLPRGRCYWVNRDLTDVAFLDPCNAQHGKMFESHCFMSYYETE